MYVSKTAVQLEIAKQAFLVARSSKDVESFRKNMREFIEVNIVDEYKDFAYYMVHLLAQGSVVSLELKLQLDFGESKKRIEGDDHEEG